MGGKVFHVLCAVLSLGFIVLFMFFRGEIQLASRQIPAWFRVLAEKVSLKEERDILVLENESLKRELEAFKNESGEKDESSEFVFLPAGVFSRYPFSQRTSLIIDAGSEKGVRMGMPVVTAVNTAAGKIKEVRKSASEVTTIFSPDWRSVVKIGKVGIEALLVGGNPPHLEMVKDYSLIFEGDEVVNVSPDMPYGLLIGRLSDFSRERSGEVGMDIPFRINEATKVKVILDYEGFD